MSPAFARALPLLLLVGCAHYSANPTPLRAPDGYSARTSVDGISVGVLTIDGSGESSNALGEDVTQKFTPTQVAIQLATSGKFVIHRPSAKLECADGSRLTASTARTMHAAYSHSVGANAVAGGYVAASAAQEANADMLADWEAKEFPERLTLVTGERSGGMIYFHGRCGSGPRKLVMHIEPAADAAPFAVSVDIP